MCTVILLRRPNHAWPLLLAGNRDEMIDRPWRPPARHWPLSPDVTAGLDELAEGSWLGVNDHGLVATILNRSGSLGPAAGKRSRGELVLEALDHADAAQAAEALAGLNANAYRPFNLVIADNRDAFWLRADGQTISGQPIPAGLSMLTSGELNDPADPRIKRYSSQFAADPPDVAGGDFSAWQKLLGERAPAGASEAEAGLTFHLASGFGTSSSAIIALPSMQTAGVKPLFLFAAGPPDVTPFAPLLL
jgi:uncharacterized protein with NRDE domain